MSTTEDEATSSSEGSNREQQLETVIADYIRSCESGTVPDRGEILAKHPELAAELRDFFGQHDRMNQMAQPIRGFGDDLSQALGPGQKLSYVGNYELLEEIARGGMGVIYKARQTTLGRIVAVKMIVAGRLATEEDVQRFFVEAKAVAGLQHPNIVAIHEAGQHEGWHYFSMDYVVGRDLAKILRENVLPAKQAAGYVRQMAEAIHYAHQQGTLHRDLKPSNILIDEHDQIRITDFGLAMRVEGDSDLTRTGQILGTPSYMPPEQAQGKRSLIGPGSDVYSLGAILYECLTGRAPFRADSAIKTIDQVIHVEAASPRILNPGIPHDLETICLKCLQKEPDRRYEATQHLADDLGHFLRGEPITARPIGAIERTWRWCKRKPAVVVLSGTLLLLLGTIIVVSPIVATQQNFLRAKAEDLVNEKSRLLDEMSLSLAREKMSRTRADLLVFNTQLARAGDLLMSDPGQARLLLEDVARCPEWIRDFSWRYLYALANRKKWSRKGRSCVSRDGSTIAVFSADQLVDVWNVETGQKRATAKCDVTDPELFMTSSGSVVVAINTGGPILLWNTQTESSFVAIPGTTGTIGQSTFVLGDRYVAFSRNRQSICMLDIEKRQLQEEPLSEQGAVTSLLFLDGDAQFVVNRSDGASEATFELWNTREFSRELTGKGTVLAISNDGREFAIAQDGSVCLWEKSTQRVRRQLVRGVNGVAAFSDNGRFIAVAVQRRVFEGEVVDVMPVSGSPQIIGEISIWNCQTEERLFHHADAVDHHVDGLAWSPDGTSIATTSGSVKGSKISLWRVDSSSTPTVLGYHPGSISELLFASASSLVVTSREAAVVWDVLAAKTQILGNISSDGKLACQTVDETQAQLIDIRSEKTLFSFPIRSNRPSLHAELSGDERRVAMGGERGTIDVFDLNGNRLQRLQSSLDENATELAFSPDGLLVGACFPSGAAIWELSGQTNPREMAAPDCDKIGFSRTGKFTALSRRDDKPKSVSLWNTRTGKRLAEIDGTDFVFSKDGNRLFTTQRPPFSPQYVTVWDILSNRELTRLEHDPKYDRCGVSIALSPDGKTLATGSGQVIKLWDAISLKLRSTVLQEWPYLTFSLRFSGDGKTLASSGFPRVVRFGDAVTGEERATLPIQQDFRFVYIQAFPDSRTLITTDNIAATVWRGLPD